MTDQEVAQKLASALNFTLMVMTEGFNTVPKDRMTRDAVDEGLAAIATYEVHLNRATSRAE